MKRIINPWLGLEGYCCFGCCATNASGLQMDFHKETEADGRTPHPVDGRPDYDGYDIVSVWMPQQKHTSWVNTLHGGVQATLLDEVCGWVVFYDLKTAGVTAKMEMRYKHAVNTTLGPVVLRGRLKEMRRNIAIVEGEIYDAEGTLCNVCECTYFTFPHEKAVSEMHYIDASLDEQEVSMDEVIRTLREQPHVMRHLY